MAWFKHLDSPQGGDDISDETWQTWLDQACHQLGASDSHLYWFTDLAAAQQQAQAMNRPILSLRLLGRLDEELSCANSRFFRQVLYRHQDLAQQLREHFVLHWSSERTAPQMTIDFGDGRQMITTITGK